MEAKTAYLSKTKFLPAITSGVLPLLKDYHDSVREEACIVIEYVITKFLTHRPTLNQEQQDQLMMLRGNLQLGWNSSMTTPIKALAEAESVIVDWMFEDAQAFLKQIVTIMLDEPTTRESLGRTIRQFNDALPFLLLNDYRISTASNSLMRVELLKGLIMGR